MELSEILLEEWKQDLECMRFERDQYWKRFGVLLTINSGLLALMGIILSLVGEKINIDYLPYQLQVFFCSIGIVGFAVNAAWMTMNFRSHSYYEFHYNHAVSVERREVFKGAEGNVLDTSKALNEHMHGLRFRNFYKAIPITVSSQSIPLCFGGIFVVFAWILVSELAYKYAIAIFSSIILLFLLLSGLTKLGSIHRKHHGT